MDKDSTTIQQALEQFQMGLRSIPFNRHAGFHLLQADSDGSALEFAMSPDLVGNVMQQTLHGGVIAAAMDMVGGAAGLVAAFAQMAPEERQLRVQRFGTLDMQVEYLRPGRGQRFTARGRVLRAGKKVCVTKMEMHNDQDELIATATGTYLF